MAGGAGRIAHAGGRVLVERLPLEIVVDLVDPVLVGDGVLQARLRHMRAVGEHDETLDGRKPLRIVLKRLFQRRHEGQVDEHHAVLRMIDDPADLILEQPRIDGVVDRADAEDAVPALEMPRRVPGHRRHAVAELDAVLLQPLGHPQRALADFGVIGLNDRPFDRARDDLALAVIFGGVVDDAMAQ
jgi:hypothetical protein